MRILVCSVSIQIYKRAYQRKLIVLLQNLYFWIFSVIYILFGLKKIMIKNVYWLNIFIKLYHYKNGFWYKNKAARRGLVSLSCSFSNSKWLVVVSPYIAHDSCLVNKIWIHFKKSFLKLISKTSDLQSPKLSKYLMFSPSIFK